MNGGISDLEDDHDKWYPLLEGLVHIGLHVAKVGHSLFLRLPNVVAKKY